MFNNHIIPLISLSARMPHLDIEELSEIQNKEMREIIVDRSRINRIAQNALASWLCYVWSYVEDDEENINLSW